MQLGTLPKAQDVQRLAGITHRELDLWCRAGILRPIGEGAGRGNFRWFPPSEVTCARLVRMLRDAGHDPTESVAVAACDAVRRYGQLMGRVIMIGSQTGAVVLPEREAVKLLHNSREAWTLVDGDKLAA